MTDKTECPDAVIKAGARLVQLRRLAERLAKATDEAMADIEAAIDHVCEEHGAKRMQAGQAIVSIRAGQAAPGHYAMAHNSLRLVLDECGIAEPTDAQIAERLRDPDAGTQSIR